MCRVQVYTSVLLAAVRVKVSCLHVIVSGFVCIIVSVCLYCTIIKCVRVISLSVCLCVIHCKSVFVLLHCECVCVIVGVFVCSVVRWFVYFDVVRADEAGVSGRPFLQLGRFLAVWIVHVSTT